MFEIGRAYAFVTTDGHGEIQWSGTVAEEMIPLIKVRRAGVDEVINTSSLLFLSATPNDDRAREGIGNFQKEWQDSL